MSLNPAEQALPNPVLLVIDEDPRIAAEVRRAMEGAAHRLHSAIDAATGAAEIASKRPDLVVLSSTLPGSPGLDVLGSIRQATPTTPILYLLEAGSGPQAIEAIKLAGCDCQAKPVDSAKLRAQIDRALSLREAAASERFETPQASVSTPLASPLGLVGDSPAMQEVYASIGKAAPLDVAVLIRGEHGTGKEAIAREIHRHSPRSAAPCVKLSCRGADARRLEDELFGRAGSEDAPGKAAAAVGKSLVLQEIGAAPLSLQTRLLAAIRDGYYETGSGEKVPFDCRVLATTTDDLESLARSGEFRSDLFYLLSSFVIAAPPIRQRPGDYPALVEQIVERLQPITEAFGAGRPRVSDEVLQAIRSHLWPGNLDELESVLQRALIEQRGRLLLAGELQQAISGTSAVPARSGPASDRFTTDWASFTDLRVEAGADTLHAEAIAETERKLFERVLRHTRGNQAHAARILGITRASLRRKLRMYGMVAKPLGDPDDG